MIAGTTRKSAIVGFAGIPIGLMLALIHLVTIPIDNTSVNPARSFGTAIFADSWAIEQLWVFIVFPIVGGLIGALIWRFITTKEDEGAAETEVAGSGLILDHGTGDLAALHRREGIVHVVEVDGARHELVQHEGAVAVTLDQARDVALRIGRPVPAPEDLALLQQHVGEHLDVEEHLAGRDTDQHDLTAAPGHLDGLLDRGPRAR